MKFRSTLFLKGVINLIGIGVFALCLFLLYMAISSETIGYYRPIVIGMLIAALPFFIALYQAIKLLGWIDRNMAFSEEASKALRNIKYCAITISSLFALGMPYIFFAADKDDAPGVVAIGLVIIFASMVIAVFAAVLEKLVQNAVDIKKENDLTV